MIREGVVRGYKEGGIGWLDGRKMVRWERHGL